MEGLVDLVDFLRMDGDYLKDVVKASGIVNDGKMAEVTLQRANSEA